MVSIPRLSLTFCHLLGKKCYGNIILYMTSLISVMVVHFDCKYSCLVENNVPIAFIYPSRWQNDDESLRIVTTSCQCHMILQSTDYVTIESGYSWWWPDSWVICYLFSNCGLIFAVVLVNLSWFISINKI